MRKIILTEDQIHYIKEKKGRKKPAFFGEEDDNSLQYFPVESEIFTTDDGRRFKAALTIKNDLDATFHICIVSSHPNYFQVFQQNNKKYAPRLIASIPPDVYTYLKHFRR